MAARLGIFLAILCDCLVACAASVFKKPKGLKFKRYMIHSFLRSASFRDPDKQLLKRRPTTTEAYRTTVQKHSLTPDIVAIDNDADILWLSKPQRSSGKTLLYFHGGAYVNPAHPQHIETLIDCMKACHAQNLELSVAIVAYTIAPAGVYPLQLRQAVSALRYLTETAQIAPSDVLIAGDSAGVNIILALLSHLAHPHPEIPPIDLHDEKLGGALLISPWVTFDTTAASMKYNFYHDHVHPGLLDISAKKFLGDSETDAYNEPLKAPADWWKDLQTQQLSILAAECEIFFDDIIAFADKVKIHNPQTQVLIASGEVHVQMVMDKILKVPSPKSQRYFEQWLEERLRD
ncbi:hypothetical protein ASPWEDRAFT_31766 [Aspergillus wentii DTO 134E9]|uniref:Alpha/beta hydrolase fold-3 domain-containing protein n=1 Tax=Aspergillus wentii DTO 134E9 TaxID=1073089 RepID=A0A1L9R834_ASPWE|nr:uncharacterized protein ASPWEDRAFT_31766 [Aspergillus wentii DTO 134E9]KAI9924921.1 hypothetical protein MW887_006326 [Aspergillus wentii]OJJ31085.1 hypothetical protein ASPWEDRAFT_31766 [Aspergillus wentii DTO 134E9]